MLQGRLAQYSGFKLASSDLNAAAFACDSRRRLGASLILLCVWHYSLLASFPRLQTLGKLTLYACLNHVVPFFLLLTKGTHSVHE